MGCASTAQSLAAAGDTLVQLSDESQAADSELQTELDDADQLLQKVLSSVTRQPPPRHTPQVQGVMQLLGEARARLEGDAAGGGV